MSKFQVSRHTSWPSIKFKSKRTVWEMHAAGFRNGKMVLWLENEGSTPMRNWAPYMQQFQKLLIGLLSFRDTPETSAFTTSSQINTLFLRVLQTKTRTITTQSSIVWWGVGSVVSQKFRTESNPTDPGGVVWRQGQRKCWEACKPRHQGQRQLASWEANTK